MVRLRNALELHRGRPQMRNEVAVAKVMAVDDFAADILSPTSGTPIIATLVGCTEQSAEAI